jgi:hypothetical protein
MPARKKTKTKSELQKLKLKPNTEITPQRAEVMYDYIFGKVKRARERRGDTDEVFMSKDMKLSNLQKMMKDEYGFELNDLQITELNQGLTGGKRFTLGSGLQKLEADLARREIDLKKQKAKAKAMVLKRDEELLTLEEDVKEDERDVEAAEEKLEGAKTKRGKEQGEMLLGMAEKALDVTKASRADLRVVGRGQSRRVVDMVSEGRGVSAGLDPEQREKALAAARKREQLDRESEILDTTFPRFDKGLGDYVDVSVRQIVEENERLKGRILQLKGAGTPIHGAPQKFKNAGEVDIATPDEPVGRVTRAGVASFALAKVPQFQRSKAKKQAVNQGGQIHTIKEEGSGATTNPVYEGVSAGAAGGAAQVNPTYEAVSGAKKGIKIKRPPRKVKVKKG